MLLRRDLLVVSLTLSLAAVLYAISFRDLAIADPVLTGVGTSAISQPIESASRPASVFAG